MDTHSSGPLQTGNPRDAVPETPPAAPAMDGKGAEYGATGQGSGGEHIRFSKTDRTEEKTDSEDGSGVQDAFSEFGEPKSEGGSDGVSLL